MAMGADARGGSLRWRDWGLQRSGCAGQVYLTNVWCATLCGRTNARMGLGHALPEESCGLDRESDSLPLDLRVLLLRTVAALDALNVTVGMKSAAHFFGPTQFLRSVGGGVDKDQIGGISTYFLTGARLRRLARRLTSFELDPRLRRCRTACCVSGVQKIRRRSRARVMAV